MGSITVLLVLVSLLAYVKVRNDFSVILSPLTTTSTTFPPDPLALLSYNTPQLYYLPSETHLLYDLPLNPPLLNYPSLHYHFAVQNLPSMTFSSHNFLSLCVYIKNPQIIFEVHRFSQKSHEQFFFKFLLRQRFKEFSVKKFPFPPLPVCCSEPSPQYPLIHLTSRI